jgi:hypothetical protein
MSIERSAWLISPPRCDLRPVKFDRWRINDLERTVERIGGAIPL